MKRRLLNRLAFLLSFYTILFSPLLIALAENNTAEEFIVNHRLHNYQSWIFVMGEVINKKRVPVTNVTVRIIFLDDDQNVINSFSTHAWLQVILPNRRAPFIKSVEIKDVENFAECKVELEHYDECKAKPSGLTITSGQLIIGPNSSIFVINIKNESPEQINYLIGIGCIYDERGFWEAASDLVSDAKLAPGDSMSLKIMFKFLNQTSQSNLKMYVLTAESVLDTNYSVKEEIIRWVIKSESDGSNGWYWIILIFLVLTMIPIIIIGIEKRKTKSTKRKRTKISLRNKFRKEISHRFKGLKKK